MVIPLKEIIASKMVTCSSTVFPALIAICALQTLLVTSVRGMNCPLYDRVIIERVFEDGLRSCHPSVQNVTVFEYYINCLSFGMIRGTYSFTTVTIVFNSSLHPGEEVAYYDIGCDESNRWSTQAITPFQGLMIGSGRRQNDTRDDCGACATPRVIPIFTRGVVFDNETHCYGMPVDGIQDLCHGYYSYTNSIDRLCQQPLIVN